MANSPAVSSPSAPAAPRPTTPPAPSNAGAPRTPAAPAPGAGGTDRPAPAADGTVLSREAERPTAGARPEFLSALSANFGDVDADGDGHLTDAEIAAGATNRELGPEARAALGALRGRQGAVEEFSNDEWLDENSGTTRNDLGALDEHPSLDAQRIREEFQANRTLLAENPNADFAPLPELPGRSLGGHAVNVARHVGTPLIPGAGGRELELALVDAGQPVDPNSRLGAYQATGGFREGTVGHAAHNAIGQIYAMAGTIGEDQIGTVFNSPEARALYNQPLDSPASLQLAEMEFAYWSAQRDQGTLGGRMGTMFSPGARDWLQQETFR